MVCIMTLIPTQTKETEMKIISNKDGSFPKHTGDFETYSPNSYSVIEDGIEIGSIIQVANFDLASIPRGAEQMRSGLLWSTVSELQRPSTSAKSKQR